MGLKAGLDVLERESSIPVQEFEPRIVQPRPSLSTEYVVAVSLMALEIQNYEF